MRTASGTPTMRVHHCTRCKHCTYKYVLLEQYLARWPCLDPKSIRGGAPGGEECWAQPGQEHMCTEPNSDIHLANHLSNMQSPAVCWCFHTNQHRCRTGRRPDLTRQLRSEAPRPHPQGSLRRDNTRSPCGFLRHGVHSIYKRPRRPTSTGDNNWHDRLHTPHLICGAVRHTHRIFQH